MELYWNRMGQLELELELELELKESIEVKQPALHGAHSYDICCAEKRVSTMKKRPAELGNGFACNFHMCRLSRANGSQNPELSRAIPFWSRRLSTNAAGNCP